MSKAATAPRAFRILIIAGSDRRQYNCPGVDGKARTLALRVADRLPTAWEVDVEDLGNVFGRARIQSCNACVSTAMPLCVWPCNCYEPNNKAEPDLMWDLDLYSRLDQADAWAVIGPINWYAPSSNLKLMFDRLVCMSGGNPREDLIDHKNPEMAIRLEQSDEWAGLSRNHLEGRTAAFFTYGDGGGDELGPDGRPKLVRHPAYFNPPDEPFANERDAYAPLVWQCRYSGIEVPDELWSYIEIGRGQPYSENQAEHLLERPAPLAALDAWSDRLVEFVTAKGLVPAGEFRAFGYKPPSHRMADLRLKWRSLRMSAGMAPEGSSPALQHQLDLNRDATFTPSASDSTKAEK
ncbi:MAG: NAD(P)H-dependent oxidoreductase [Vicinamibacterales bacterium]